MFFYVDIDFEINIHIKVLYYTNTPITFCISKVGILSMQSKRTEPNLQTLLFAITFENRVCLFISKPTDEKYRYCRR